MVEVLKTILGRSGQMISFNFTVYVAGQVKKRNLVKDVLVFILFILC